MFERYTENARRVIFFARYESSQFGSPYIETEHLLLGLLREDKTLANRFLRSRASFESIRKQIEGHTTVREKVSTSVDLPLSNECKRILAYAAEEAERLAHKHIGSEHLLLGLLREDKCFAAQILTERGVQIAAVRKELQAEPHQPPSRANPGGAASARSTKPVPVIFKDKAGKIVLRSESGVLGPLPSIGESIQLDELGKPIRKYRVLDIAWTYPAGPPETELPEEVLELEKRILFIVQRMENAIANHEFEKAKFYSAEEHKERENLRRLREQHGLEDAPPRLVLEPLREVVVTLDDEPPSAN